MMRFYKTNIKQGDSMGLELDNPQELLLRAEAAIKEYKLLEEKLSGQRELEKRLAKSLDGVKREQQERIDRTLKTRAAEIAETYDKQLSQLDGKLKKIQQQRDKAKNQGIKGRIAVETEELIQEGRELKRQLAAVLKKAGAPSFCRTKLFYTLFSPGTLSELLLLLAAFLLFFAAIPLSVYYLLAPEKSTVWIVGIYIVDILLFGGLYVLIANMTNGRHAAAIREGKEIRRRMRQNKRSVRLVIKGIRSDGSEEGYHLEEYDDELSRLQRDRAEVIAKKQSAQNTFETVTRTILSDEIEASFRPQITELSEQLGAARSLIAEQETEEKNLSLSLSRDYEQFLGKLHMNEADIRKLRTLLDSGRAASLMDAVMLLEEQGQESKP